MRLRASVALALTGVAAGALPAQCPNGTPPPCSRPATAAPRANSVAVLYFDNLSRDSSDEYLADGMTEELISRLSQVERLEVKSRTAVRRWRGTAVDPAIVARTLNVSHLVSGSVRRSGQRLRVTVELMRPATGVSVWSRTYDRGANELVDFEAEIAESVAVGVSGRLAPAERRQLSVRPTSNAAAYDHYLRGTFEAARRTTPSLLRAIREYEEAVRLDPRYVIAMVRAAAGYQSLGQGYFNAEIGLPRDSLRARAQGLLDRALRIDSTSAEAWLARAFSFYPEWRLAREAFGRAVALDPRNAETHHLYGLFLRDNGDDSAAVREFRRALDLEPERPITLQNLGQTYAVGGQYREALRWLEAAVALRPEAPFYYEQLGVTRLALGDTAGARAAARETAAHGGSSTAELLHALIDARAGDTASARRRVAVVDAAMRDVDCRFKHDCLQLAIALAHAGLTDRALSVLERTNTQDEWIVYWTRRPEFDPIRNEPRFQSLRVLPTPR